MKYFSGRQVPFINFDSFSYFFFIVLYSWSLTKNLRDFLFIYKLFLAYYGVCVFVKVCAVMHRWKSEDNFGK